MCPLGAQTSKRCKCGFMSNRKVSFWKGWKSSLNDTRSALLCMRDYVKKWHMHLLSSVEINWNCLYFLIYPRIMKNKLFAIISTLLHYHICLYFCNQAITSLEFKQTYFIYITVKTLVINNKYFIMRFKIRSILPIFLSNFIKAITQSDFER